MTSTFPAELTTDMFFDDADLRRQKCCARFAI
jgi:hypothetical protein